MLGGGGLAGIAWHIGMLTGMADRGLDVGDADLIIGTSAGATAAAQVAGGTPLIDWFRRQVDPALQNKELRPPGMSIADLWEAMVRLLEETHDPAELCRRTGTMALEADTVPEPVRRAVVAGRLASDEWPARRMATTAVDALTGERHVFEAGSKVGLIDAVAASSAVPGIWPPVTIGDARYIDGGVYSSCNADLAVGFDRVLVLAPMVDPALSGQLEAVAASGRSVVVSPDEEALAAFTADALDPAVRAPSAEAGRRQGAAVAASLEDLWRS